MYRMGLLDAANKAVLNYKHGGRGTIAQRLGKSEETLRKELAGVEGCKLGAFDLFQILEWTEDEDLRAAIASHLGGVLMTLPSLDDAKKCPFNAIAELTEKNAAYTAEILKTFADGHVSKNEARRCEAKLVENIATQQAAIRLVRASYQAGVPEHERRQGDRRQTQRRAADRGL